MDTHADYSQATHTAKCDEVDCTYVAMTHAHDDEGAVEALATDLANHNMAEHSKETDPQEIKEAVGAKMQTVQ